MNLITTALKKYSLPKHSNEFAIFDNCFSIEVKRNVFPNSVLEFTNKIEHQLTANNDAGVSECFEVLQFELDPQLIEVPSNLPTPPHLEPITFKRYSYVCIGEKTYTELCEELLENFILYRTAKLITYDACWATTFIRLFTAEGSEPTIFKNNT